MGFPTPLSAVFAGARFLAFTTFLAFFGFALTAVGDPFRDARCGRVHLRVPRAFE